MRELDDIDRRIEKECIGRPPFLFDEKLKRAAKQVKKVFEKEDEEEQRNSL